MIKLYDMKLKYKFALVIAVAFVCIVTLGFSFKSLQDAKKELQQTNTNARQIGKLYNQINEKFSEAERSENKFLLDHSLDHTNVTNDAIATVLQRSEELKKIAHDPEFSAIINEMESSIQQFSVLFKQLVDYKIQTGLDHNSGMNGKLRKAVHDVEDILKQTNKLELSYSMLMMRRHEKDYLMRKLDKYVVKIQKEHKNFNQLLDQSTLSQSDKQIITQKMDTYISTFMKLPPIDIELSRIIDELHAVKILAESNVAKVDRYKRQFMSKGMVMVNEKSAAIAKRFYITISVSGLIIIGMLAALARSVLRPINNAAVIADSIASGNLDNTIRNNTTNEVGQLLCSLNTMQSNIRERIEREAEAASINSRVTQALDNVSANVMVADPDGKIIYMNDAIKDMMHTVEPDMKKALPNFDSSKLIGSNFDDFHTNPSHQRNLLENLKDTYVAEVPVGKLHMRIIANPVYGENNERLGTVAEWFDRTQQIIVEEEIQEIVNSAKSGDLSKRINLEGKNSFFERLSRGVNEMVDVSERAINDTVKAISAMSRGNLTETITAEYEGSFGQLKDDVNSTIEKLTEVMGEITSSAHLVLNGSQEIAQGNTNLSQRTEQQASNLEETASSMEEMTSTVRQNADNATQANQLASGAREQAEQGGIVVNQAVSAMSEITESSNKIAAIIGVIDEIAFQTNLLALNAAVEAARAGEQGRGFAVVASEVRNLAGRSATAAKEIKDLIEDSVIKVEEGSKLVDASGQTLEEIMTSVKKVSDIIAEIAAASMEQSEGIEQVNKAISQMDEMTQQNAALVEEAAAASESMGEQAGNLNEMVGFFKTGDTSIRSSATQSFAGTERRQADRPWGSNNTATVQPKDTQVDDNSVDNEQWETF